MKRLFALLIVAALFGRPLPGAPIRDGNVVAELVSPVASIEPGHPFTVGLRLQHDPHWHTYWLNPGTGLPTTLTWHLPPRWKAGDIQWPTPTLVKDTRGNIAGMGYQGEVFLLVTLTPPATLPPKGEVTLKADASWLMCSEECVPGDAALSLTLPVSDGPPPADPQWSGKIARAEASLPKALPNWHLAASRSGTTVTLTVTPAAGSPAHTPEGLYFFSADGLIDYSQPQSVHAKDGGFEITMPVGDSAPPNDARLVGVLSSADGWEPGGSSPGLKVDVPLTPRGAAPAGAGLSGPSSSGKSGSGGGAGVASAGGRPSGAASG
ncbi:MAG: protein-disulfide reductase DsbD domain-containing protein, partial [Opitutaceae bacterium]